MIQWHPLFAWLLRPILQDHYDVQTNFPVGDLPRQADILLLRRTANRRPPFRGLWRHLTVWNVLEFKGRTETARVRDLDLLVEVGLGIDRRLNEERERQQDTPLPRDEVSFWYLVSHLGRRFMRDATRLLGDLEEIGDGLWRVELLGRRVMLVSNHDVAVDRDSLPVHIISSEPVANERSVAELVMAQPEWANVYGPVLPVLHPQLWEEVMRMARKRGKGGELDWDIFFSVPEFQDYLKKKGLAHLIDMLGVKPVIEEVGLKRVIDEVGVAEMLAQLTPEQRAELKRQLK